MVDNRDDGRDCGTCYITVTHPVHMHTCDLLCMYWSDPSVGPTCMIPCLHLTLQCIHVKEHTEAATLEVVLDSKSTAVTTLHCITRLLDPAHANESVHR
jgi:hypothetical protein